MPDILWLPLCDDLKCYPNVLWLFSHGGVGSMFPPPQSGFCVWLSRKYSRSHTVPVSRPNRRSWQLLSASWMFMVETKLPSPAAAAAAAKSLQSCLTLCDPRDGSPPGPAVPGILQARALEWVAISSSNAWKWKVKVKLLSRVWLFATPWTAAYQAPPSLGFSRQEYWSGLPLPLAWEKIRNQKLKYYSC